VGSRDPLLRIIRIENLGSVLRADVRTLTVQLRRVVSDREKDAKQLSVRNLRWVEHHANDFSVTGAARADLLVRRRRDVAAGVAGHSALDAFNMLVDRLNSPEAAAGEYRDLLARCRCERIVHDRDRHCGRRRRNSGTRGPLRKREYRHCECEYGKADSCDGFVHRIDPRVTGYTY
jgi:hypothetical protein